MVGILLHREERLNSTSSVALLKKYTTVASRFNKIKMYSVAKRYAHYADDDSDEDEIQPPTKKQCESASKTYRAVRILTHRYALTATSYKYAEIGITVGIEPAIYVILGDNRGTQLKMTHAMWVMLLLRRDHIQGLLNKTWASPLKIRVAERDEMNELLGTNKYGNLVYKYLFVEVCAIKDSTVFKITIGNQYLYLMPSSMDFLLNLEYCIEHVYDYLYSKITGNIVGRKVREFINIVKEKNITTVCDATKAVRESEIFDEKSAVDCELLACAMRDIMYIANNTK